MRTNQTNPPLVAGEPARALTKALTEVEIFPEATGYRVQASWEDETGMPLVRALLRIEAELLMEDADRIRSSGAQLRTERQRRADAFVLLTTRVADAMAG